MQTYYLPKYIAKDQNIHSERNDRFRITMAMYQNGPGNLLNEYHTLLHCTNF